MNYEERKELLRRKLASFSTWIILKTEKDSKEEKDQPPVTCLSDLPRGDWFVIGKSGRREEWTEQVKLIIQKFRTSSEMQQCVVCRRSPSGPSTLPAVCVSQDGKTANVKAVCLECAAARTSKEIRDLLAVNSE